MGLNEIIYGSKFRDLDNGVNIFYKDTHDVNEFLVNCNKETPFVLISHNGDGCITDNPSRFNVGSSNDADSRLIPDNMVHWYGQNVNVVDDRISSIGIGLENTMWFPEINKIGKIIDKTNEPKNIINLMYICFTIRTNPSEREEPYRIFNNHFTTIDHGINGNTEYFDRYMNMIYNHKFVLSPAGNGPDCHRKWESLYLNTIPIEKRCINNSFYEGKLPICFVNNWSDITEEFLNNEYTRITNTTYNMDLLKFSYWKNKILNTIK